MKATALWIAAHMFGSVHDWDRAEALRQDAVRHYDIVIAGYDSHDRECQYDQMPLSYAAMKDHPAIVKHLLRVDAGNVDLQDWQGRTSLSWAATRGHENIAEQLLGTHNVELNSKHSLAGLPFGARSRPSKKVWLDNSSLSMQSTSTEKIHWIARCYTSLLK